MAEIRRYRCKDGRFTYLVRVYGPDGSRLRETFRTRSEAEKWARAIEADRDRGTFLDPKLGKTAVAEMAKIWFAGLDVELKTLEDYESLWRTHVAPTWANRRLDSVRPLEVKKWTKALRESGLSHSRIKKAHLVLRKVFDEAVENGYLARSPVRGLNLKGDATARVRASVPPTATEACEVALAARDSTVVGKHAHAGYDVLVMVGLDSGLRPGELRALKRGRCHLDGPGPWPI